MLCTYLSKMEVYKMKFFFKLYNILGLKKQINSQTYAFNWSI